MIKYRKSMNGNGVRPVPRKTLSTTEIAREIERETGIPTIRTMCVIDAYAELVVRHLREGDHVSLDTLGTFKTSIGIEKGAMIVKRICLYPNPKSRRMFEDTELQEITD